MGVAFLTAVKAADRAIRVVGEHANNSMVRALEATRAPHPAEALAAVDGPGWRWGSRAPTRPARCIRTELVPPRLPLAPDRASSPAPGPVGFPRQLHLVAVIRAPPGTRKHILSRQPRSRTTIPVRSRYTEAHVVHPRHSAPKLHAEGSSPFARSMSCVWRVEPLVPADLGLWPELDTRLEVVVARDQFHAPALAGLPLVVQSAAIVGAVEWSLRRGLAVRQLRDASPGYFVPVHFTDRAGAPELVAPIQIQAERLLVRWLVEPRAAYATARTVVVRRDELPGWLLVP